MNGGAAAPHKTGVIMKKLIGLAGMAVSVAVAVSGCMSFDYVGQSFAETPDSVPVEVFRNRSELPPGRYKVIGRGVLTAPDGVDSYDIDEKLIEEAREHGADAVCIVGVEAIQAGTFRTQDNPFIGPSSASSNPANLTPDGAPIQVNTYGGVTEMGEEHHRIELQIRVLMLKNRNTLEKILAERDEVSRRERRSVDLPPPPESPRLLTPEIPVPGSTAASPEIPVPGSTAISPAAPDAGNAPLQNQ